MKNLETTNQTIQDGYLAIPKTLHRDAIDYLFGLGAVFKYLDKVISFSMCENVQSPEYIAIELMGLKHLINHHAFCDKIHDIMVYYSKFDSLPDNTVIIEKTGKKIRQAMELEAERYNRKPVNYESI